MGLAPDFSFRISQAGAVFAGRWSERCLDDALLLTCCIYWGVTGDHQPPASSSQQPGARGSVGAQRAAGRPGARGRGPRAAGRGSATRHGLLHGHGHGLHGLRSAAPFGDVFKKAGEQISSLGSWQALGRWPMGRPARDRAKAQCASHCLSRLRLAIKGKRVRVGNPTTGHSRPAISPWPYKPLLRTDLDNPNTHPSPLLTAKATGARAPVWGRKKS
jgi:hypothetical protein